MIASRLILVLVLLSGACTTNAQERVVDVQHYAFELTLLDDTNEIAGTAHVTVAFTEDNVSSFNLDLIGNQSLASETGMTVREVKRGATETAFTHRDDRIAIAVDPPGSKGEERTYSIAYAGTPADGLIIAQNKHGDRTFFGDNWPNRARHWLPSNDHPSDKATVEFMVTAPEHYQVIGNGRLVEESDLLDGTRKTHWRTDVPLATKITVIGAAHFAVQYAGDYKGIPIQNWVYPQDREAGFHDFGVTHAIMKFFEENIGPYSYEKLANVQSKTRYGGMENASNIFYSENAISGTRANEGLVAHEVAHQWFGNSATEADWQHIWLSEGFATYFTQLYMEHAYGRERMVTGMHNARNSVIGFYDRMPNLPLVNPEITDPNQHLNANSYQKGAWVLHMLRHRIGDEAFWNGIRSYYKTYRNTNATSAQLQHEMEQASGQDLDQFFEQWLYQAGQPILEGAWRYNASTQQVELSLEQTQKTPAFDTPLEVALVMADGTKKIETVQLSGRQNTFTINSDAEPASLELDPDTWLLMRASVQKN